MHGVPSFLLRPLSLHVKGSLPVAVACLNAPKRYASSDAAAVSAPLSAEELDRFFDAPTGDTASFVPSDAQIEARTEVNPTELRHLLRLAALEPPKTHEHESQMLRDLRAQLHFVKQVQKVDTTGVAPLTSIRDETTAAHTETRFDLDALKEALAQEEVVGDYHKRIRRKRDTHAGPNEAENWDVLGQAPNKVGRFFVVKTGAE